MSNLPPSAEFTPASQSRVAVRGRAAWWDKAGIGVSAACMVHCTTLPILVALSPTLAGSFLSDASFHQWLLVLILPTAFMAFGLSWWRHRRWQYLLPGVIGLACLVAAALLGHEPAGEWGEKVLTFAGGVALVLGHALNLLRRNS